MATHKSALKEHRRNLRRRAANRWSRARMRTALKRYRQALAAGELDTARELLVPTLALVDRTAKLGGIHDKAASRTKSRLSRALNRASA